MSKNSCDNNHYNQVQSIVDAMDSRPKIVQCIQCVGEETLIEACILQVYDQVDKILVIEGGTQNKVNAKQATSDGHSLDRTVEIIKEVKANKDPDKKIVFVQIDRAWASLEELKNTFFQYMQDGDWMLITDTDEFIHPETVSLLREAISIEPWATEFIPTFYHFWKDRRFIRNPANLGFGVQHQRFIKFHPGMHYQDHPVARDKDGVCTYFDPRYLGRRFVLPNFDIFHYSYMNFKQKDIAEKKAFYEKELTDPMANNERSMIDMQFTNYTESKDDLLVSNDIIHPDIVQEQGWYDQLDERLSTDDFPHFLDAAPYNLEQMLLIWAWRTKPGYSTLFNSVDV